MDTEQTTSAGALTQAPAHLWIGSEQVLIPRLKKMLKEHLCPQGGCDSCIDCSNVNAQEHHALMWLTTEKSYTLDALEAIHTTIAYALDAGTHYFFVIQKADQLSVQASNKLLKSIEEPPAGYHFILMTPSREPILPTIRSRCVVYQDTTITENGSQARMTIWNHFTSRTRNAIQFLKDVDELKLSDQEAALLCQALLSFWIDKSKKAVLSADDTAYARAHQQRMIIQRHLHKLPMPGSSKLFLKNLYLLTSAARMHE